LGVSCTGCRPRPCCSPLGVWHPQWCCHPPPPPRPPGAGSQARLTLPVDLYPLACASRPWDGARESGALRGFWEVEAPVLVVVVAAAVVVVVVAVVVVVVAVVVVAVVWPPYFKTPGEGPPPRRPQRPLYW
jgi:hypothetical protein